MSRVIDGLLTSKMNAASLSRGDMIFLDGTLSTVTSTCDGGQLASGDRAVRLQITDEYGLGRNYRLAVNRPVSRVTGGRSGGQI
jgi:hypothetical protein